MDVAFGEFDLLLKELVVEVILDGEVLAQQVEYALRREHFVHILRQHEFGLYRHVQQHLEAVGCEFDISFLGVNTVLEGIDTYAYLVG